MLRQGKAFSGVRNVTDVLFPWLLTYMYNFSPLIVTLPGPCLPHVYYCPIHCPCTGHEVRIMMDTCKNNFYTNWIIINRAVNPPAGWRGREIGIIIQLLYCVDGSDGIVEYILCNNHASTRIHLILIEVGKQGSSKVTYFSWIDISSNNLLITLLHIVNYHIETQTCDTWCHARLLVQETTLVKLLETTFSAGFKLIN